MWIDDYGELMDYLEKNPNCKKPIFKIGDSCILKNNYFDIHIEYASWTVDSSDIKIYDELKGKINKITDFQFKTDGNKMYYEINKGLWISEPCLINPLNYNKPRELVYENIKILKFDQFYANLG